ncbi:MAG: sigma-70 family RNA polymerase sigma factor [Oscillochloris sp.]|nr:sigma-70 family RNA polymerase sigma factor [Oscillochloris sp.]
MSEFEMIHLARSGDQGAWEALVRAHQEPIFRLAYLLLGDRDEADDVAQETFIRAARALAAFDTDRPLRPWLLQIAANLARNRHRTVRRYLHALQQIVRDAPRMAAPPEPDEASGMLWQAIRRLRRSDQEVIYLRYFLELSEAESAHALAIAPGTVKSRLSRALGRLRELIDHEFPALRAEREV